MSNQSAKITEIMLGQLGHKGFDLLQELIEKGNTLELKAKVAAYLRDVQAYTNPAAMTVERATELYLQAVGDGALQPSVTLSFVARNGSVILKNVNGFLAIVTARGNVMDRVGGKRLEGGAA